MTTTAKTLANIARLLGETRAGSATGGSTTTLVDTTCTDPNDWYNGGTIWLLSGSNAGKTAIITDYNSTTKAFTFAAQSAAVAAGVSYLALRSTYPREALINALNDALREIGRVLQIDASLTAVSGQLAYTLPAGVRDVRRVQWGDDRDINCFWREVNGELLFDRGFEPDAGAVLYIWYVGEHAEVALDADTVTDYVDAERLAWTAAYYAALTRSRKTANNEPHTAELVKQAQGKSMELSVKRPILIIGKDPHYGGW